MSYYENLKNEIDKKLEETKNRVLKSLAVYKALELSQGENLLISDFSNENLKNTFIESYSIENAWWDDNGFLNVEFKDGATAKEYTFKITQTQEFRLILIKTIL